MCKKYPGPRCSFHTKQALVEAQEAFNADPSTKNAVRVQEAQYAYNTSPDGINELRAAGNELDAQHFEAVRERAKEHLKAIQAKEALAMRKELDGLYSDHGIEEVRAMGDDDLADRLKERRHRASLRKGQETGIVLQEDFRKPVVEAPEGFVPEKGKTKSLGSVFLAGAVQGGIAGYRNPKTGVVSALQTGMRVGKGEASKAEAEQNASIRVQEKAAAEQEREATQAQKAFEREQARLKREQERIDKADTVWHAKLEADCIRYIKAQQREAAKQSRSKHTKPSSAPKTRKAPQSQAA